MMLPRFPENERIFSSPKRIILFAAVLLAWCGHIVLMYNHSIALGKLPDTIPDDLQDGVVYQTTDFSCGPASLATLFRYYNIEMSEREWAELAGTGIANGTHIGGLRNAAIELGFDPIEINPKFDQLKLVRYPSIIFQSRLYHFVTFWGIDYSGKMIIRDPAAGRTSWSEEEYLLNTPNHPVMLVMYPGRIQTCDRNSRFYVIGQFQGMMKDLGTYSGAVDGTWNRGFERSIRNFQRDMGIDITGIINPETSLYIEGMWFNLTQGERGPIMAMDRPQASSVSTGTEITVTTDGN